MIEGNLAGIFYRSAVEASERTAIRLLSGQEEAKLSYGGLYRRALNYAAAMEARGFVPDSPVIIILKQGEDLVSSFLGCILHGSIPSIMPFLTEKLSPERYREALQSLFEITEPQGIITYPSFSAEVLQPEGIGRGETKVLLTNQLDVEPGLETMDLAGFDRHPEDIVLLQHSSGTTGLQKGVALSHRAVLDQVHHYAQAIHMDQEDVVVSWLPLYHDMGLIAGYLMPLILRAELVLMSPFEWVRAPAKLLQAVSRYSGTLTWLPNFAYNFCAQKVRDRQLEGVDLSSWRAVVNCSEPMRWESHQAFLQRFEPYGLHERALATCYAMAENVFAVTQGGIKEPVMVDLVDRSTLQEQRVARPVSKGGVELRMLSAGKALPNTEVRIADEEGNFLPDRQVGEIVLRGSCLLSGYYKREDLTREAFRDGWYRTGDLGYRVGEELFVTGRMKDLIIVGGKNIHPQDLERLAGEVEGVYPGRVVAFGIYDEGLGTEEVAILAEADVESQESRRGIAEAIRLGIATGSDVTARYIRVVERGWLIKTSSGKIARSANRDKFLEQLQGETYRP